MDCVNHPGVHATAYCQNCGKAMCAACVRQEGGQILCEPCWTAWQAVRAPFIAPPPGGPNVAAATLLGFIPGVGAMYNGQFVKGFIHVAIFAVLCSIAGHFGIFGLFIAAWIAYMVFDAHQTAKARLDGEPLPDPMGLNELAGWFHTGMQTELRRMQNAPPAAGTGSAPAPPPAGSASPYPAAHSNPYQSGYQPPPFAGTPPAAGFTAGYPPPPAAGFGPGTAYGPGAGYGSGFPPAPPVPPSHWRRPEPIAAIVLIGMGVLFLMGQMDWFSGRMFEFSWPLMLIALGAWLLFRRMHNVPPAPPGVASATPVHEEPAQKSKDESQGGSL